MVEISNSRQVSSKLSFQSFSSASIKVLNSSYENRQFFYMGLVEISNSRHVLSKLSFQNYPSTLIKVFRNKLDSVNKGNKQFLFKFFNETFTKTSVHERNMPFSYNLVVKALFKV